MSPSDQSGPFSFHGFLLDMNRLFEEFVTQVLKTQIPASLTVHAQASTSLDLAGALRLRPDVLIRCGHQTVVVGDCKYKRLDAGEHRHHDLYQLLAYCTALDVHHGVLIYPLHLAPMGTDIAFRQTDVSMSEVAINLSRDPEALRNACARLTAEVAAVAGRNVLPSSE